MRARHSVVFAPQKMLILAESNMQNAASMRAGETSVLMGDGIKFFCFGGALSFDKSRRIRGKTWWEAELPTKEDYYEAVNNLKTFKNQVDFVITHDCPLSWMGGVKDSPKLIHEGYIQSSSNIFLEEIASNLHFRHWFFGHYHIDVKLTPIATELFHNVVNISRYISYPVRYGKDYVGSNSRWNIPTM